jgi:chromosome segregation ATPase
MFRAVAITLLSCWSCQALTLQTEANPIRKVVTILQDMQKELEVEGVTEQKMFDKFMCYCDGNTDGMSKAATDAGQKIEELKSKLESEKAEKAQLDQELVQHKLDREGAKSDLEQASTIREKENEDYASAVGEQKEDLEALTGAIAAIEKGMGSFLQTATGVRVIKVVKRVATDDFQRDQVLEFLQAKNPFGDYNSRSGEITGILKSMKDEMSGDLKSVISAEEEAAAGFAELAAAKKSEIAAASAAIESKTVRSGELAVAVTTTADDIEDTTGEMKETEAFLANLASQCAAKKKEWNERQAIRAEEIAAVSEAIKILNDDDALDLFKKTLSLAQSNSFLQKASVESKVLRARKTLQALKEKSTHPALLSLIEFGMKSKQADFTKIVAQIDGMMKVLAGEQKADDEQFAFCEAEIAKTESEKSDIEDKIAASKASIEEMTEESSTLATEIATLQDEIKALDKAVAEATATRKEEHDEFLTFQSENNAALQLIEKAKNRLFKFYRPNLHKEEPKRELTEEEKLLVASGQPDPRDAEMAAATFVQRRADTDAAPAPPPETWGAYQKKDGKSNGVIGLMEMLMKESQDGITTAEHEEETAQADYERLMDSSQKSRARSVESITSKEVAKANLDTQISSTKEALASQEAELTNAKGYLTQLHADCDFLLENHDLRKAARENEVEGLKNAKSVLAGASFE